MAVWVGKPLGASAFSRKRSTKSSEAGPRPQAQKTHRRTHSVTVSRGAQWRWSCLTTHHDLHEKQRVQIVTANMYAHNKLV